MENPLLGRKRSFPDLFVDFAMGFGPPTNPPTNSPDLHLVDSLSKAGERSDPVKTGFFEAW